MQEDGHSVYTVNDVVARAIAVEPQPGIGSLACRGRSRSKLRGSLTPWPCEPRSRDYRYGRCTDMHCHKSEASSNPYSRDLGQPNPARADSSRSPRDALFYAALFTCTRAQ